MVHWLCDIAVWQMIVVTGYVIYCSLADDCRYIEYYGMWNCGWHF